jgi:hypothetical protein
MNLIIFFGLQFDHLEEHLTCSWDVLCHGSYNFFNLEKNKILESIKFDIH